MKTKIISAFPGTGKSYYHKNHPETTLDSDSSFFSWMIDEWGDKLLGLDGKPIATLAVLGPTRMDYGKIISLLKFMNANLADIFHRFHL